MDREYKPIKMDDWEEFGGGYLCKSFFHKTDDTVMLKLYDGFFDEANILREHDVAKAVKAAGINTPECLGLAISDDGRKGVLFQRVKNKRSFARMVGDEPERAFELGEEFGREAKKLHSTKCDTVLFEDKVETNMRNVIGNPVYSKEQTDKIVAFLRGLPKRDTCCHGDFHFGNMIQVDGKNLWIDLADFGYGDPRFDVAGLMFPCVFAGEKISYELYHCHKAERMTFWKGFLKSYAGVTTDEEIEKYQRDLMPFMALVFFFYINNSKRVAEWMPPLLNECLKDIL